MSTVLRYQWREIQESQSCYWFMLVVFFFCGLTSDFSGFGQHQQVDCCLSTSRSYRGGSSHDKLLFVYLLLVALPVVCPTSNSLVVRTKLTSWNRRLNKVMAFVCLLVSFFFSEFIWVHHGALKHVVANSAVCSKAVHHRFKVVTFARSLQYVAEECADCHSLECLLDG